MKSVNFHGTVVENHCLREELDFYDCDEKIK